MMPSKIIARFVPSFGFILASFAFSIAAAAPAPDAWVQMGPLGGGVTDCAVHPTDVLNVYAVISSGKLYHTIDGGASWSVVSSCPAGVSNVWLVDSSPSTLFVVANTSRLYKSTNAGAAWTELASSVRSFAFDERYPQRLFIGGSDGIVRKSVDGGGSWIARATGSANRISAIAVSTADSNTVYAGDQGDAEFPGQGIFKTTDGGTSWIPADAGIGYTDIAEIYIDPAHPDTLFASTSGGMQYSAQGLYRSTNGGDTWSAANTGFPCEYCPSDIWIDDLGPIPGAQGSFSALTSGRMFRSNNAGATWIETETGIDDDVLCLEPWAQDPAIRYVGAVFGLWRVTPWSVVRFGVESTLQQGIAIDPNDSDILYTVGLIGFKSADGGATWTLLRNGSNWASGSAIAINPQQTGILFVGEYSGPISSALYRSTDAGASWDTCRAKTLTYDIQIDPVNPDNVYVAGNRPLLKSADGGDTWTELASGNVLSVQVNPLHPATIYVGTYGYGVKKSINGGATWTPINNGLPENLAGIMFEAIAVDPLHPDTLYCSRSGARGLFKSTNGGAEWYAADSGLTGNPDIRQIVIDPLRPSILYARSNASAVYRSVDGGRNWEPINAGLPSFGGSYDIALDPVHPNVLYLCTYTGLYRYESSFDPATDTATPPLAAIDLRSYPNPFSGSAAVEYVVARRGDVRVTVYDVAGRTVAVLAEGPREPGRYMAALEGRNLSPGVYFIRASIDGRTLARKCVLVK